MTSNTLPGSGYPVYLATDRDGLCFFPFYPPPNPSPIPPTPPKLLPILLFLLATGSLTGPLTGPHQRRKLLKLPRTFNYSATSHLTSHKSLNIALCCNYHHYTTTTTYFTSLMRLPPSSTSRASMNVSRCLCLILRPAFSLDTFRELAC